MSLLTHSDPLLLALSCCHHSYGSHLTFILYDSSSESSVLFVESLVRTWDMIPPLVVLVDNRPPYGEGKFEPQIKYSDHATICIAKKSNLLAPLQLAARRLLNDSQFTLDPKAKPTLLSASNSFHPLGDSPTPSSAPNPATIAAAAASTSSSNTRATPASWNAKKASSSLQRGDRKPVITPPQPLSRM